MTSALSNPPSMLEIASQSSDIVVALAAVLGFGLTLYQLRKNHLQQWAGLLLELDTRWEGGDLVGPRQEFQKLFEEAKTAVFALKIAAADERRRKVGEELAKSLLAVRKKDINEYGKIMRVCGFFETVGYAAKRRYIGLNDILDVFGGAILIASTFGAHIDAERHATGEPKLFENFTFLAVQARKRFPNYE